MKRSRKCGDNPWMSRWFIRQNKKEPRYFCTNCLKLFRTGRFSRFDDILYDDICPSCGAPGSDLTELAELYKEDVLMNPLYLDYDINDLTVRINDWFEEKGLKDPIMQFAKLNEEVGEMAHELTRGNKNTDEMKDAIGDTFATLVGMVHHLGLDLSECINMAYRTIHNRKGEVTAKKKKGAKKCAT